MIGFDLNLTMIFVVSGNEIFVRKIDNETVNVTECRL